MKRRLFSIGVALLGLAALTAGNVLLFRVIADKSRLESRNAGEQVLNSLFSSLRAYDDFGAAIDSDESLKKAVIGVSVVDRGGQALYSWGEDPMKVPAQNAARVYSENPARDSLVLVIRPSLEAPPPPPSLEPGKGPDRRSPGSFLRDTLRSADAISLEIRQPAYWKAVRARRLLFPLVEAGLAALVFFVRFLILRNEEYRRRIEEQKNLVVLGTAASTLAHEIKNPLLSIRLQTGILERILSREGIREIGIINDEVERISALSHRVNDILRDPAGQPGPVNAAEAAREVGRRMNGRNLVRDAAETHGVVLMDPERLRSVLENLLRNALESGSAEEEVGVEVSAADGRVVIDVLDRGKGVPPRDRERIFDPFFTTKSRGSGIGLTICRRFVLAAGGSVTVEGRAGGGSRARVVLPAAPVSDPSRGAA